jgi:YbbR domain-containing protein
VSIALVFFVRSVRLQPDRDSYVVSGFSRTVTVRLKADTTFVVTVRLKADTTYVVTVRLKADATYVVTVRLKADTTDVYEMRSRENSWVSS